MDRRTFLRCLGLAMGSAALPGDLLRHLAREPAAPIPKRPLGRTGVELSILGLGGVTVLGLPQNEVNNLVHRVMDRGVNYLDVAPSYRERWFIADKTLERTRAGAERELHQSLRTLGVETFDLYQFHAVNTLDDVERIFGPGGAAETFLRAREQGKIRYIGFSSHSVKAALAMLERFDFDTVLFPVNYVMYFKENFGPQVIDKARRKGVARLALKAHARGRWPGGKRSGPYAHYWFEPVRTRHELDLALRFALSQPITAAVGPGIRELFEWALEIAARFRPLTPKEQDELRKLATDAVPLFRLDL